MRRRLDTVVRLLDPTTDGSSFYWSSVDYDDVSMVKSALGQQMKWTSAKAYLAALKGVIRTAWQCGPMSTDQYPIVVRFGCRTDIAAPVAVVFDLSLRIDAHLGSMRRFGEQAVAGVTTGQIGLGQQVTWQARHFGIRWRMASRISHLQRPVVFVDEQVSGPFAALRHVHRFDAQPHPHGASAATSGVTRLVDVVEFRAPLGRLGRLAEILLLGWYVRRLIESRNAYLKRQAEALNHTALPPDTP